MRPLLVLVLVLGRSSGLPKNWLLKICCSATCVSFDGSCSVYVVISVDNLDLAYAVLNPFPPTLIS